MKYAVMIQPLQINHPTSCSPCTSTVPCPRTCQRIVSVGLAWGMSTNETSHLPWPWGTSAGSRILGSDCDWTNSLHPFPIVYVDSPSCHCSSKYNSTVIVIYNSSPPNSTPHFSHTVIDNQKNVRCNFFNLYGLFCEVLEG